MQSHAGMKSLLVLGFSFFLVLTCPSQVIYPQPPSPSTPMAGPAFTNTSNYAIQIQWKTSKSETNFLRLLTTDGLFNLDTVQTNRVKVNNNEIPASLHPPIDQAVVVVKASRAGGLARDFIAYLRQAETIERLTRFGFTVPRPAAR